MKEKYISELFEIMFEDELKNYLVWEEEGVCIILLADGTKVKIYTQKVV